MLTNSITKIFAYPFVGQIFKIHEDMEADSWILEIRNGNNYQTSFAALDLSNGQLLWQDLQLSEPWWLGISAVNQGLIYFHFFPEPQKPSPKGITSYSVHQQKILWQHSDYQLLNLNKNNIVALDKNTKDAEVFYLLDSLTGEVIEKLVEKPPTLNLLKKTTKTFTPSSYLADTPHFETVKKFLNKILNIEICQSLDYLEYNNLIVISFFIKKNEEFQNNLLILDTNAQILLQDVINDASKGISNDTFWVVNHHLFIIRNKCELIAYQL